MPARDANEDARVPDYLMWGGREGCCCCPKAIFMGVEASAAARLPVSENCDASCFPLFSTFTLISTYAREVLSFCEERAQSRDGSGGVLIHQPMTGIRNHARSDVCRDGFRQCRHEWRERFFAANR
jgi:hypothetical protein